MVGPLQEWATSKTKKTKKPETKAKTMMVIIVMHLNFQMFLSLNVLQYHTLLGMLLRWCRKKCLSHVCHEAVGLREHKCESAFLTLKHRGNLFKPAASVITVCTETEKCFLANVSINKQ